MECPACGRTNKHNAKFCQYCGTTLVKARPMQNTKSQSCPVCNASLKPGISFCTQCGTPVKRSGSVDHSKRRNTFLPTVMLLFLLLAGCLFLLIAIKNGLIPLKFPLFSDHTTQTNQVDDGSSDISELKDHTDGGVTTPSDNSNASSAAEGTSNSEETTGTNGDNPIENICSSTIRSRNTIDKEIELGKYSLSYFGQNNMLYSNHDIPVALFCPDEQGQNKYKRSYYYMGGELLFAKYEGNDLHQFYFDDVRVKTLGRKAPISQKP